MKRILLTLIVAITILYSVSAQSAAGSLSQSLGLFVFPANGQDAETQNADEMDSYNWARQQTGYDPINPTQVQAQQVETGPDGSAVRGAARGAAAGAAIGAIAGDAGKGAAIGAVAGGAGGRRASRVGDQQQQQQNNQAAADQTQALKDEFNRAFTASMEGKGYTVK